MNRNQNPTQVKEEARKRLESTDWSQLADVGIKNKSDFDAYRKQVRIIYINGYLESESFPDEPKAVWYVAQE
jgi:hypothetical protein